MAFAILKGLDAPADVSSATLDADGPRAVEAVGCSVSGLAGDASRLEFDRLDAGLPLNLGLFGALQYRFIPVPDELNRYMLTIRNLPDGDYAVHADGRALGTWPARRLAEGVNLASATADGWEPGGPWEAAAWALAELTEARTKLFQSKLGLAHHLPGSPVLPAFDEQAAEINARLEALQHAIVAPRPFHFVVERKEAGR
ncbi:hypothetical protein [Planctomyces sp. SH-PL62]|uniref:hypothetical protein n=1 Tax=Planctomyces sp. SH-PL62 TaxID=1636152 RepID=UPI00078D3949|nr:hypothetical protein [Planctomyces sp. SH-PL62]AMV40680.1 hypothetical protein VT85_24830 [Planctomyces sp. SH-PL62]